MPETKIDPNQYVLDFIDSLNLDAEITAILKGILGNVAGWSLEQLVDLAKELVALKLKGDLIAQEEAIYTAMTFEQRLARRKAQVELLAKMNSDNEARIKSQKAWLKSVSEALISILWMLAVKLGPLAL